MNIQWKLERIEQIRLEKLQERIGLEDREVITMALEIGFSALERSAERAQEQIYRAVLEDAEREAAEREKHSLRGRWRRFRAALAACWDSDEF